jgi:RNA polymerase sigma factor (sigma-70 family)
VRWRRPSRAAENKATATRYDADLELARQCAAGDEKAWDRFVLEYRPVLYRAADALDPSGGARELADSLYADLYGLRDSGGERQSLFRYFQGRSSLATWLRAVLAQRVVDRTRSQRRFESLGDEVVDRSGAAGEPFPHPAESSRGDDVRLRAAVSAAILKLTARERLRLGCYYQRELTLAETGRVLGEHEATVSRQLARTRRAIRESVERQLRRDGLSRDRIAACFEAAAEDPGPLDLRKVLEAADRKKSATDRST